MKSNVVHMSDVLVGFNVSFEPLVEVVKDTNGKIIDQIWGERNEIFMVPQCRVWDIIPEGVERVRNLKVQRGVKVSHASH